MSNLLQHMSIVLHIASPGRGVLITITHPGHLFGDTLHRHDGTFTLYMKGNWKTRKAGTGTGTGMGMGTETEN